jgi:hypothetical protein
LRSLHLIVGALFLAAFLLTGFLMSVHVPPLSEYDTAARLFYRSRHVYLMFGASTNLVLGLYMKDHAGSARWIQRAGSLLLLLSPPLAFTGYLSDPSARALSEAVFGMYAAFALFGGTVLHLLAQLITRHPTRRPRP